MARRALVAALSLAAATLFHSTLLFGGSLHGFDWGSHHYHYFDWVRTSLTEHHTLPLFMNDAWITKNFLANAESPVLGPLVGLLAFLPTGAYVKLLVVAFTAAGLAGMFWLLRDLGVASSVALFGAVAFGFGGFFAAHVSVGHAWALGGYLLPALVLLYRRGALGSARALHAGAAVNALAILGGQHQPFIWQNLLLALFAGLWAAQLGALFPLRAWARLVAWSAGLAAVKLLPMLAEFADYAPTARTPGLLPGLLLSALAGSGQGPWLERAGLTGVHGSGWWEYAFYVGPMALAWIGVGALFVRRGWAWLAIGVAFLALAVQGPVWPLLDDLPVWRTQRSPSRFLFLALFAFTVAGALGVQRLWAPALARAPRALHALGAILALLLAFDLCAEARPWQRAALGPPLESADHRPRPLRLRAPGAEAELIRFAPNRLVYRVQASAEARLVFPLRQDPDRPEWRVTGLPARTQGGKLAIDVPPGRRDVVLVYRPPWFRVGAALSAATLAALALSTLRRWRRR